MPIHIPAGIHASRTKILSSYEQLILVVHIESRAKKSGRQMLISPVFVCALILPFLLMILHFSQIGLTDDLTFTVILLSVTVLTQDIQY